MEHEVEGVEEVLFVLRGVAEGLDGLRVVGGGFGVDGAGDVEREEPLDEIVVVFEFVKGEGPEVVEVAAGVVGGLVEVEGEEGHCFCLCVLFDNIMLRRVGRAGNGGKTLRSID